MHFSQKLLFLSLIPALPFSGRASEPDADPLLLDKLHVSASRGASATSPSIEFSRAELFSVPGGTEVIDASRFLRGRASTVEDTFALSAGVIAQSRFGSDEARLSIRGSGLQRTFHGRGLRVMQDGVPLNLADGSFDFQAIEPTATAYMNVWRGANALASGASTLGGAIDYVSRNGLDSPGIATRIETGSWDYLRATVSTGGARGRWDSFATYTRQSQDGFRDHAVQHNDRVFANLGVRVSPQIETRFYATAVRTDSELPGSLTLAQIAHDPRQAAAGNRLLDQKRDFTLWRAANKTSVRTGDTWWDFSAAWMHKDLDHPIFQVIEQRSDDVLFGAAATHRAQWFGREHRLRAGLSYTRGVTRAANFVNVAGERGALVSRARQTAENLEAFAEDQVTLGRGFTLIVGASAAINERRNERIAGGVADYSLRYDRAMPKLGLRWERAAVQFFTNVSGSYEPPSFSETLTLNTARHAQTATTYEIGSRGAHGFVRWDASVYSAVLKKELLTLVDPVTQLTATVNADRTRHQGVEFSFEADLLGQAWNARTAPAQRLVLRGAWTHGDFHFDDDPRYGRNQLAGLPPHLVRGELSWEHRSGWHAGPTVEWVPQKTFIDFRNTLAADGYAIVGLRIGRRDERRGLAWFIDLRNLADKRYVATTGVIENAAGHDQAQFFPGDGRALFAGIDCQW